MALRERCFPDPWAAVLFPISIAEPAGQDGHLPSLQKAIRIGLLPFGCWLIFRQAVRRLQGLKSLSELCVPMYITETGCADKEGERRVSTSKAYFDEVSVWLGDQAACCLGCITMA